LEGGISYEYANLMLLGLAVMHSRRLDTELVALSVWDGRHGDGIGGTASMVKHWRSLGHRVEIIHLDELRRVPPATATVQSPEPPPIGLAESGGFPVRIVALLFADAVGFSKLDDEQIPRFVREFLGAIGSLARTGARKPLLSNTWGDGLYFVFGGVRDAGLFALDLCDRVATTSWAERGLPASLSLRIALHTGPAYACIDPVTARDNFIGAHVSRAARIEPVTPPGHVYASQAFAAIAAAEGVRDFACEYVGQMPLAKGYGTFPTFHVRRC